MQGATMRKRKDTWTQIQTAVSRDKMQINAMDMKGKERWLRVRGWTFAEYIHFLDLQSQAIEKANKEYEDQST